MIIAQVCLRLATIKGAVLLYWGGGGGKGEVLINTDLDRFVNNIWEK